jgi:hypothetical protein
MAAKAAEPATSTKPAAAAVRNRGRVRFFIIMLLLFG